MRRATITGAAIVIAVVVLVVAIVVRYALEQVVDPTKATRPAIVSSTQVAAPATHAHSSVLYGRVTVDGAHRVW